MSVPLGLRPRRHINLVQWICETPEIPQTGRSLFNTKGTKHSTNRPERDVVNIYYVLDWYLNLGGILSIVSVCIARFLNFDGLILQFMHQVTAQRLEDHRLAPRFDECRSVQPRRITSWESIGITRLGDPFSLAGSSSGVRAMT